MDCFVAEPVLGQREALIRVLLAKTARYSFTFPRRIAPELFVVDPPKEGVGNAGCPLHPQPRAQ